MPLEHAWEKITNRMRTAMKITLRRRRIEKSGGYSINLKIESNYRQNNADFSMVQI